MKVLLEVTINTLQRYRDNQMRINKVIKSTDIFEDIVSQIPRGINDPRQVLTYGYSNLVSKIGLENAKRTNESYAAKILSVYYRQHLDEGLGTMLGKTAGHVAGASGAAWRGLKGFWKDAKAGYKQAKSSRGGTGGGGTGGGGTGGGGGTRGGGGTGGGGTGGGGTGGAQPTPRSIKAQIAAKQKQMKAIQKEIAAKQKQMKAIQKELDGLNKMLSPNASAQSPSSVPIANPPMANPPIANPPIATPESLGSQQTAQDKITLKAAADKGIHENRKKKHRTFESRFLKMKI